MLYQALSLFCFTTGFAVAAESIWVPAIEGDWWQVASQPDLGEISSPRQQPVDFAIWQARDGTWQLWSCIRYTADPKNTRLLYRWEGRDLTQRDWTPMEIAQKADPSVNEFEGRIGAPHVVEDGGRFVMFYHSAGFHAQVSDDGKRFTRQLAPDGSARIFGARSGTYGRDIMLTRIQDKWHAYYGGSTADPTGRHYAAILLKVAQTDSLFGEWSDEFIVNSEGQAGSGGYNAECPQVIFRHGWYYLFRTEVYGANNRTHVYRARSPHKFGIDSDAYHVATLPIAAPEIFEHDGQDYVAALNPSLDGIRVARLGWRETTTRSDVDIPFNAETAAAPALRPTLAPETLLLATPPNLGALGFAPELSGELAEHTIFRDARGVWQLWAAILSSDGRSVLGRWSRPIFIRTARGTGREKPCLGASRPRHQPRRFAPLLSRNTMDAGGCSLPRRAPIPRRRNSASWSRRMAAPGRLIVVRTATASSSRARAACAHRPSSGSTTFGTATTRVIMTATEPTLPCSCAHRSICCNGRTRRSRTKITNLRAVAAPAPTSRPSHSTAPARTTSSARRKATALTSIGAAIHEISVAATWATKPSQNFPWRTPKSWSGPTAATISRPPAAMPTVTSACIELFGTTKETPGEPFSPAPRENLVA